MVDSIEIAEFVGIMLGDGSIGIYDCKAGSKIKRQHQLKVTLDSRNKEYIEHVFSLMCKIFGVEPVIFFRKDENTADIRTFRKEKVMYAINDLKLKISPKHGRMKIPEELMESSVDKFVLRGLFDTDGSVTIFSNNGVPYPRLEVRICKSPAQNQIMQILDKYQFGYRVQSLGKGSIKIRLSGKSELRKWLRLVGSSNRIHIEKAERFLT